MREDGLSRFLEVGPKKVLLGLVKKCLPKEFAYTAFNVEDLKILAGFYFGQSPSKTMSGLEDS